MKKFFRYNKVYIIIIVSLILYLVIFRAVSLAMNRENSKYASIIVDGVNIWEYKESSWHTLTEDEFVEQEATYDLYSAIEYYGDYTIKVNNKKLYAFDSKYNSLQYKDSILAVNSNYDIVVYFFGYSEINDDDSNRLNSVINSSYSNNISKIAVDVNNDDKDEYFYVINYYDSGEIVFTDIYYYDGKLKEIVKNEEARYMNYDIAYILDINDDGKYEIIISSRYFDNVTYKVYKLDGKEFKLYLE